MKFKSLICNFYALNKSSVLKILWCTSFVACIAFSFKSTSQNARVEFATSTSVPAGQSVEDIWTNLLTASGALSVELTDATNNILLSGNTVTISPDTVAVIPCNKSNTGGVQNLNSLSDPATYSAMVVNTNISSLNTQRTLNQNSSALSRSLQKLSSGSKIIPPTDDPRANFASYVFLNRAAQLADRTDGGTSTLNIADYLIAASSSLLDSTPCAKQTAYAAQMTSVPSDRVASIGIDVSNVAVFDFTRLPLQIISPITGITALSQANTAPQIVLSLFK